MGSEMLLVSCTWAAREQQDQLLQVVSLEKQRNSNIDCSLQRYSSKLKLQQPTGSSNCTFSIKRTQQQQAQDKIYARVCLVSNARLCELAVQRSGDAAPQYISTLRGQQLEDQQLYQIAIDLMALPGWQLLVLKLLSLQGSKDSCQLCELAVLPGSGSAAQQASSGSGQQQQQQAPLSQMDELRLLNESVAKQVHDADSSTVVPESLQLLFGKATQQPAGGAAAAKSLSAMVARGMLLKLQEQPQLLLQQQPQQQQQQEQLQHQQLLPEPQQQQRPPRQPQPKQVEAWSVGTRGNPSATNDTAAAAAAASAAADGSSARSSAVVLAVQRLEGKVDALAGKLLWAMEQLLHQQQQIMQRLDALEAGALQPRV